MSESVQAIFVLIGACFAASMLGASFIFGVACVCRWMKWAPVNTTINVHNYGNALEFPAAETSGERL